MKLSDFFSSFVSLDDTEKKRRSSFLKVILKVTLFSLPIISIIKIITQPEIHSNDYVIFTFILFLLFFYFLLKKQFIELVSFLFVITSWLCMTILAWMGAGLYDTSIIAYIVIIFVSILLVGFRIAFAMSVFSIVSVWILAYAQNKNLISISIDSSYNFGRDFTAIVILVLTLVHLYNQRFRNLYERINKELQDKKIAEEKLLRNEIKLKEQNIAYQELNDELADSNIRILRNNLELQSSKEKAHEIDLLKTSYLQNISHELRIPLNGIVGFANLLRNNGISNEKREEYIEILNSSCSNLASIINDLVDISKIDAGATDLHLSEFYIDKLFKEIELFYNDQASEKGLEFSVSCQLQNGLIKSDRGKIIQILNNLVSNAIKFTSAGFVKIHVTEQGGELFISVIDSGIGINDKDKEIIFDRFRQAEAGVSELAGGTKLGLSIAKGLVHCLGGNIWFKSEPNHGSVFSFSIPLQINNEEDLNTLKTSNILTNKKVTILIAEDEDINYMFISEILFNINWELIRAINGLDAVEIFKSNNDIDIVLMDLKMPKMDGYEATQIIKGMNPSVPVIAITAFAMKEEIFRAKEIKFDDYITKPISRNKLLDRINAHLKKKNSI